MAQDRGARPYPHWPRYCGLGRQAHINVKRPGPGRFTFINMAIKWLILIDLIVVRTTLAQIRGSAGVVRSRVGLMADGGTSLCRY